MSEQVIPIRQLVRTIISEANHYRGEECHDALREGLNALAHHPDRSVGSREVVQRIPELESPTGAGFLAVWCGAAVEHGADPNDSAIPVLDAMLRWSDAIRTTADGELVEEPDAEIIRGLESMGRGLVAHLSRSPSLVERLKADLEVVAEIGRVEPFAVGAMWVHSLLRQRSGTLVVLHIPGRKGVRASYDNLQNCFQLFTLLQHALEGKIPGARKTPAAVLSVARGESVSPVSDSAWWHYGPATVPEAKLSASIWGEMNPEEIPEIDGRQVLLLWPPQLSSRGWDSGFFSPVLHAMPPNVTVLEDLEEQELTDWWARLRLPKTTAPRWKFWQRNRG